MVDEIIRRIADLFDEHRASPAHPDLTAATNRIINQINWLAARQLEMEKQMSVLTDKVDALIAQRDAARADAASVESIKADLAAAQQAVTQANAERDAALADAADAIARMGNAGV